MQSLTGGLAPIHLVLRIRVHLIRHTHSSQQSSTCIVFPLLTDHALRSVQSRWKCDCNFFVLTTVWDNKHKAGIPSESCIILWYTYTVHSWIPKLLHQLSVPS